MMKTKFRFYLLAALAGMLVLGSCEMDAWEINTTDIDGNWFVSKVELTDASSIESELYTVTNTKKYDVFRLSKGNLMFTISSTSEMNRYRVKLYEYDGESWDLSEQDNVVINGENKFSFAGRRCKFKHSKKDLMVIKVKNESSVMRYTLERTLIKP